MDGTYFALPLGQAAEPLPSCTVTRRASSSNTATSSRRAPRASSIDFETMVQAQHATLRLRPDPARHGRKGQYPGRMPRRHWRQRGITGVDTVLRRSTLLLRRPYRRHAWRRTEPSLATTITRGNLWRPALRLVFATGTVTAKGRPRRPTRDAVHQRASNFQRLRNRPAKEVAEHARAEVS
jgi:hypothetical protein